jgi:hypothetical protein
MTSWIRVAPKKKTDDAVRPFLYKTGPTEFCEEFNQYFYATLYSQSVGRPLAVYDQVNPVGPTFSLIKETFTTVPGMTFVDSMIPNATALNPHDGTRTIPYVNSLSREDLQMLATSILEWSVPMIKDISALRTQYNIPDIIDVGVHVTQPAGSRARDVASIISAYIDAVGQVDTRLGNPTLRVFVAAEQQALLQEFMQQAKPSWKIYTIPLQNVNGFSVVSFDRQRGAVRSQAYKEFIATLSCLQTSENLITSLSTETGKFLFMTNTTMTYFRSMEATTFVAR